MLRLQCRKFEGEPFRCKTLRRSLRPRHCHPQLKRPYFLKNFKNKFKTQFCWLFIFHQWSFNLLTFDLHIWNAELFYRFDGDLIAHSWLRNCVLFLSTFYIPAYIGARNTVGTNGRSLIFAQSRSRWRSERHFGLVDDAVKDQTQYQTQYAKDS